jgi:hypothetical protein
MFEKNGDRSADKVTILALIVRFKHFLGNANVMILIVVFARVNFFWLKTKNPETLLPGFSRKWVSYCRFYGHMQPRKEKTM